VTAEPAGAHAELPFGELVEAVASAHPAPGAGPSAAWTCALAAALVEMVSAVALRKEPGAADAAAATRRRERAAELRAAALALADEDVVAYTAVLDVLGRREEPGHGARLVAALSEAADPPLAIAETAGEVARLAAEAAAEARGAVKGEAVTAAVLAEAVARACAPLVDMNLGSAPNDSRRARVREIAELAGADLARALA
jgi:formiminotetrahydrofolate cyclodeaminase